MASEHTIGYEPSVEEQANDQSEHGAAVIDEAAERERRLEPRVELEVQAKVDTNHPDATPEGLTLAAEERFEAREREIQRTRERWDRRPDSDREARSRRVATRASAKRRDEFAKRAASVDRWQDPERADPREQLARDTLAAVNQQARRLAGELDGWSRAAISRRLAERVAAGVELPSAVVDVAEELRTAPGQVIPIAEVGAVRRREVAIEGRVAELWAPSDPSIAQVGLLEDDTGRIKLTVWKASHQPRIREGERVRIRAAAKSWYDGRVSVALTGRSTVFFPERGRSRE